MVFGPQTSVACASGHGRNRHSDFGGWHREVETVVKIQSVRIKNFRTLKDVTIPFDSVTTFIGPNGAGKSTVLRALDWYFNGKPGPLTEKDCSFGGD